MPIYGKPDNSPYEVKKYPDKEFSQYPNKDNKDNKYNNFKNKDNNQEINPYKKISNALEGTKVVDLQVFQPPPSKGANPYTGKKPFMPIEPIALTTPYNPPQYQSYVNEMMKNFYTPFIYKDYNIQIGAPNANHEDAYKLFEDMAPPTEYFSSYNNLRERCNLAGYIKGNFVTRQDGEMAELADAPNSLNSRLNFLGINSFDPENKKNPYSNLGDGFLLYTSCYPIMKDRKNDSTMCSKSSVGMNIRVYCMTKNCYLSQFDDANGFKSILTGNNNDINNEIEKFDRDNKKTFSFKFNYEPWRENHYYQFIRTVICGNNISPNFVQSYCYFQTLNPDIYFKYSNAIDRSFKPSTIMTILTESPNYSLYMWGSNIQNIDRNVSTMTQLGFKPPKLWTNIIEQIIISFYVMFKYKFVFKEMDIKSNFFIKVINKNNNEPSFWKYNIKGINYYIRNFGNLLLVDSSYQNLQNNTITLPHNSTTSQKQEQKENANALLMDAFHNKNSHILSKDAITRNIYKTLFNNMKNILSVGTFSKNSVARNSGINSFVGVTNGDGIKEYNEKMQVISNFINKYNSKFNNFSGNIDDIENIFDDFFNELITNSLIDNVHNRVGTFIRDDEISLVKKETPLIVKKGDIILHERQYESYVFVLFIECDKTNNNIYKCITKEQDILKIVDIPKDLTCTYLDIDNLKIEARPGEPIANEMDVIDDSFVIN